MKILITGSTGLIGTKIIDLLKNKFEFIELKQPKFDLIDKQNIINNLSQDFDLLLHLAAYTNVDGAEKEKELCRKINVQGVQNLLDIVQLKKKKLIHISTDFVFDGTNPPYFEDSKSGSINSDICYYGKTKYEAEQIVKNKAMIVRLSYPYRQEFSLKSDFVRTIKSLLKKQKEINLVNDSIITPTFINDIVYGLEYLINHYQPEIYHLVGSSSHTPYEAGQMIAKTFNLNQALIKPISYQEYFKNKAPRPIKSIIKSNKNTFYPMSSFSEGLKKILHN